MRLLMKMENTLHEDYHMNNAYKRTRMLRDMKAAVIRLERQDKQYEKDIFNEILRKRGTSE